MAGGSGGDGRGEGSPAKAARVDPDPDAGLAPLDLMAARNKRMHSEASVQAGRDFKARPTDVFVATYPKCGTTWVTQICHQLRTGGNMDFGEISEVCPWDILAHDCGQDLDADHVGSCRVWKSHERAGDIAKGGKYIHVCRDPGDAFVSFYRFMPGWMGLQHGDISPEEFASAIFGGVSHSGGIWDFFAGWWELREQPDVLWVCFEDLKQDLRAQVKRIASFMEIPCDEALLDLVVEQSSFKYMEARQTQFDEHFTFEKIREQMRIPKDFVLGVSKVRAGGGTSGESKALSPKIAEMLARRWEISMRAKTGLGSYEELRAAVAKLK